MRNRMTHLLWVLAAAALLWACGSDTETKEVEVEIPAPSITVTGDVALLAGATTTFTAATNDGEDTAYEWASDAEAVATVDADGVVTGVAAGTAIITATGADTGAVGSWGIHVYVEGEEPEPVAKVMVSGDIALEVGATATLAATTVDGEDAGYAWESSDEAVATVDAGVVTGVAAGTAIITATGADTGAVGSWGIHVYVEGEEPEPVAKVMVSGDIALEVGATATLAATTVDGEDAGYAWESSDEAVATVDAGVVTGVAVGPVTITATGDDTGEAGSWNMYVWEEAEVQPPDPRVEVTGGLSVFVGDELQLEAATIDGEDSGYTWESSDEGIATVDETGLVMAVAPGDALITATGADTGAAAQHGVVVLAVGMEVPYEDLWAGSGHADATAEAFVHWDEDDPPEISTSCAKCHSTPGYLDFLGLDGTDAGVVDNAAPIGTVVSCAACHNSATMAMDSVTFPSGDTVTGLGKSARCMQCHQGRQSTVSVDSAIETAAVGDDEVSEELGFKNVHYFAAGATLYGSQVRGGYQYADKHYDGKFDHEMGFESCNKCHNVHSLEVEVAQCGECHAGATDMAGVEEIRMPGSITDFDGDAAEEGIDGEIAGLQEKLFVALQAYALDTVGTGILYDSHSYPYFFIDTNGNGEIDDGEVNYGNKYATWSPRLLRGAYNYQYSLKDPGAYAHNAKYVIALLYDSIEDLGGDVEGIARNDGGHFDGTSDAFRHWDEDGSVSSSCAKCHSADGFEFVADNGQESTNSAPFTDGLRCNTCHTGADYAGDAPRKFIASVTFPGELTIENDAENPDDSFICMTCHSGRHSKKTIDDAIAGDSLGFKNVHYLPAGAMLYGSDVAVGYEYDGKEYAGKFEHYAGTSAQCSECHEASAEDHSFHVPFPASCQGCHSEADGDVAKIRKNRPTDYDGDGDADELLADELHTLEEALYAAIQAYAADAGNPIIYFGGAYPYYFIDTNGNGDVDPGEAIYPNKYASWDAALMKGAHNLQFLHKEHGAWAHNTDYMAQLLIDSIEDLGGDISGFNRP